MPKCIGCQMHEHFGKEKEKNNQMLGLSHIFYNCHKFCISQKVWIWRTGLDVTDMALIKKKTHLRKLFAHRTNAKLLNEPRGAQGGQILGPSSGGADPRG